jgi:hypothetical protein
VEIRLKETVVFESRVFSENFTLSELGLESIDKNMRAVSEIGLLIFYCIIYFSDFSSYCDG